MARIGRSAARALVAVVVLAAIVAACQTPGATESPPPSPSTVARADPELRVVGRGETQCPGPPFGCLATFSVRPPDERVTEAWEPGADDPRFDLPRTGAAVQPVAGSPAGLPTTIGVGQHTLIGAAAAANDVLGSPGLDLLWVFTCTTAIDVRSESSIVEVTVTFVPADDPTQIDVRQR
jgi:hypothetical protein